MEMVLRAAAIYLILLIIFKIAGRRTPDAINQL
ncbi:membrane protein [Klebsiella pneumoniae]|uniref:Membrane protein n=1 Tax=Klebsiella pneumoniae TaxID=573 RepID=A0A377TW86_KLEPN|nr:membrane protein [Klebsiella pneumoniae]